MKKKIATIKQLLIINSLLLIFASCSLQKQISRSATQLVLKDSSLTTAHVGISIYEPATNKYWFNYQGDHYFVPASNTKIPTCYAAMKYLGDSLVGLNVVEFKNLLMLYGSADPTFLLEEFRKQPVFQFLRSLENNSKDVWIMSPMWEETGLGSGWAWNDYDADYMAERSAFPIYGNVISFSGKTGEVISYPSHFSNKVILANRNRIGFINRVKRLQYSNEFILFTEGNSSRIVKTPFIISDSLVALLLRDTLKTKKIDFFPNLFERLMPSEKPLQYKIHSQPTDSLLKPMMHRSDNFFAEQSLLMVSNELLGVMNDEKIIDTLLKTDFKDLPQKPRWVDGSGLSRYNLFSPQDFVFIFNKMKNDFGMDRIKNILATGNTGTLNNYYKAENGYVFAKTGTLSGVVSISGFLYTKKNKLLIFSVLVNNHNTSATAVRRAVEKFIEGIRARY